MSLPLEAGGHRWENHSCRLFQSSSSRTIGCSGCPQRSHCANTRGACRTCGATFDGGITLDDGKSENKSSDGYKYAVKAAICWLIYFDRSMVLWYIQITMFERPWQSKTGSSCHMSLINIFTIPLDGTEMTDCRFTIFCPWILTNIIILFMSLKLKHWWRPTSESNVTTQAEF